MPFFKTALEKRISERFKQIDANIKNSFTLIRQDIQEMQKTIDAMRNYLKKEKKQTDYAHQQDNKIRKEFREDVDEFTQKIYQLSLALSKVRELQDTLVTKKHLAQIEETIRTGFKEDLTEIKETTNNATKQFKEVDKRLARLEKKVFPEKNSSIFGWIKKK